MKRCSASLVIREMPINTTMIYPLMPVRKAIIKKTFVTANADMDVEKRGTLVHCWLECKLVQAVWKTIWSFLRKLKTGLLCDSAVPPLGIYPKETKILTQKDIYTPMFRTALFTIAKTLKQLYMSISG